MRAWDEAWRTEQGRAGWLKPDPWVRGRLERWGGGARRALDLGAGVGRHTVLLARRGHAVHALDASPAGLAYLRAWAAREGLTVAACLGDMGRLPYRDDAFDLVLAWNVVYHGLAREVRRAVGEIGRVLRPGGLLLCTLISVRHARCGVGRAVEPSTYVEDGAGERAQPHHYVGRAELERYLAAFRLLEADDWAPEGTRDYHWRVAARHGG